MSVRAVDGNLASARASGRTRLQWLAVALLVTSVYLASQLYEDHWVWTTLALLWVLAAIGLWMIWRLARGLSDPHIVKLQYVYILKLAIVLVVLFAAWVPQLNPGSPAFGYDPQRYYFEAYSLARNGFSTAALPSLNYAGILYFYGIIFALLGHNPAIPALINAFITLVATLLLVRVGYQIKRIRGHYDWTLGLAMILPEVVWYDALTSRETLVMAMLVISMLSVAGFLIQKPGDRVTPMGVFVAVPALLLIGIVRTSALFPVMISLMMLFVTRRMFARRRIVGFVIIGAVVAAFLVAPVLSESLGGYRINYLSQLAWATQREDALLDTLTWSNQSFGLLLVPHNPFEAVAFAPVRLMFYVAAPLPAIRFTLGGLADSHWSDWQALLQSLSALLYVLLGPLALASLWDTLKRRGNKDALAFHIPFWVTMFAIAGGNQMINERYRVMAVGLLWGCIWLGRTCNRRLIRNAYLGWGALLVLGGFVFIIYKFLLV